MDGGMTAVTFTRKIDGHYFLAHSNNFAGKSLSVWNNLSIQLQFFLLLFIANQNGSTSNSSRLHINNSRDFDR